MNAPADGRDLGRRLVEQGLLTEDQLWIAMLEQKEQKASLEQVLVRLGYLSEASIRESRVRNLGHRAIDLSRLEPDPAVLATIPAEFAKRHRVFPMSLDDQSRQVSVAMADPNNVVVIDQIRALLGNGWRLDVFAAGEDDVTHAVNLHYGHELSIDGILHEIETGEIDAGSIDASQRQHDGPVVRLIDAILTDAIRRRASDIHFEPEEAFVRIRYRIDGVMRQIRALHMNFWPPMVVRLKIVAGMNIAESRAPQDGRTSLMVNGRTIDFRAAVQPSIHGENFVFRVLDRAAALVKLESMDLAPEQFAALEMMMARPEGIVLVTGPTGSGKTTTLYSIMARLNKESVNIMTLEDPVEYPLPMIRQSNLASGIKLDFASGIRSLMRQDPDIILVGEIRDADTATMALRAAMTGHQVYSTMHTNSAAGAVPRLVDLGLKPETLAGNLIGVIGQRLVRRLCMHCRQAWEPDADTAVALGMDPDSRRPLYRPAGCLRCEYRGYRGRVALMEILRFDVELDDLVSRRESLRTLVTAARRKGFRTLADDAVRRIVDGSTSIEEAGRVVDLTTLGESIGAIRVGDP